MTNSDLPSSLRYANDNMAGYHRESKGDALVYSDENRIEVKSQKTLKRINELVIPPMWQNVWICKAPKGYIQAVGRDAKVRKQYIYHQLWNEYISEVKYNKLASFAKFRTTSEKPETKIQFKMVEYRRKNGYPIT